MEQRSQELHLGHAPNSLREPGRANALVGIDDAHRAGLVHEWLADDTDGLVASSPTPRAIALARKQVPAADLAHRHLPNQGKGASGRCS